MALSAPQDALVIEDLADFLSLKTEYPDAVFTLEVFTQFDQIRVSVARDTAPFNYVILDLTEEIPNGGVVEHLLQELLKNTFASVEVKLNEDAV